jgi:hypothetical protein
MKHGAVSAGPYVGAPFNVHYGCSFNMEDRIIVRGDFLSIIG